MQILIIIGFIVIAFNIALGTYLLLSSKENSK